MHLAVIFNEDRLSGKLTRWFTGCYAYHVAWVDLPNGKMYDMHFQRRRRLWPSYYDSQVLLFDVPEMTVAIQERQLETQNYVYGVLDYALFLVRPLFHLFGKSTRNVNGVICSEMVNNDMRLAGIETPWEVTDEPPSPCDIYRWIKDRA